MKQNRGTKIGQNNKNCTTEKYIRDQFNAEN